MEKQDIEQKLGFEISDERYNRAINTSKRKLQLLIQRFGDCDGVRRTPSYLAELVIEAIKSELLTDYTVSRTYAIHEVEATDLLKVTTS